MLKRVFKIGLPLSLVIATGVFVLSCNGTPEPSSYFRAKEIYAKSLDNYVGGRNPNFRIVAVKGPIYPSGQLIVPGSVEPLSDACVIPTSQLQTFNWAPLPTLSKENGFTLTAELPNLVAKAVKQVTNLSASIIYTSKAEVSFTETSQQTLQTKDFVRHLKTPQCVIDRLSGEVTVIRGIIHSKEKINSSRSFNNDANIQVFKSDFIKVQYTDIGDFSVEDTKALPRFYIVTNLLPPKIPRLKENATTEEVEQAVIRYLRSEASDGVITAQPSNQTIEKLGGIVPE